MVRSIKITMLFCGLLASGCTLLKKQKETQQQELHEEMNQQQMLQQQFKARQSSQRQDSITTTHWVEIWPKGRFSFKTDGGFTGEAEKIRLMANHTQQLSLNEEKNLQLNSNQQIHQQQKQNAQLTSINKTVDRQPLMPQAGYLWFIFCLSLMLYVGYKYKISTK